MIIHSFMNHDVFGSINEAEIKKKASSWKVFKLNFNEHNILKQHLAAE